MELIHRWKIWKEEANNKWTAIDSKSNKLYSLSHDLGQLLFLRHDLLSKPFDVAIKALNKTKHKSYHFVDVEICGSIIRITSLFPKTIDFIREELRDSISKLLTSSDVVAEFVKDEIDKRFLRAIDETDRVRQGAVWKNSWTEDWKEFDSKLPIIPPFKADVFANRFVCLHAALLSIDGYKGIIVCGNQGTGKTTFSLIACKNLGLSLLSDEVTLIEFKTLNAFGVPIPIGIYDTYGIKKRAVASEYMPIQKSSIKPIAIIVLSNSDEEKFYHAKSTSEALSWLLPHHRNIDNDLSSDIYALMKLAESLQTYNLVLPSWPASVASIDKYCNELRKIWQ